MQIYEVNSLLDSYYLKNKDGWEQARLIAYMTAQVNSKDTLTPEDIIKFHWEKQPEQEVINNKEIELEIKQIEDILNKKL